MSTPDQPPVEPQPPAAPPAYLPPPAAPPAYLPPVTAPPADPTAPAASPKSGDRPVVLGIVTSVVLGLVLAAGAVVFALRSNESPQPNAVATTQPSASPSPTHSPTPTPSPTPAFTPYTADIEDLLLPMPSGATRATLTQLNSGMTDSERVATIWNSNDSQWMADLLKRYQFSGSADRVWQQSGRTAIVVLLQFSLPMMAEGWYAQATTIGFGGDGIQSISTGIPDSRYIVLPASNGITEVVGVLASGQFAAIVDVGAKSESAATDLMKQLAVAQVQRLPKP